MKKKNRERKKTRKREKKMVSVKGEAGRRREVGGVGKEKN